MALEEAAISDDVDRMYTVFFDGFFNWLTEQKLSKDNIRDVTSAVRDLMMGHGVSSKWRPGPPFLAGFRFDPTVHCARELRELGKSWMPPRRPGRLGELLLPQVYDSSNGWTVDHPAGYIDKYLVAIGAPPRRRGEQSVVGAVFDNIFGVAEPDRVEPASPTPSSGSESAGPKVFRR